MFRECWDSFTESNAVGEAIPNGWGLNKNSAASEFSTCSRVDKSPRIGNHHHHHHHTTIVVRLLQTNVRTYMQK